jgi:hypothetical protein
MQIQLSTSSLSDGRWYEYLVRFALGGAATAFTGLISSTFGASIGGLFLALPAIFCASATLIERHEIRRKRDAGGAESAGAGKPLRWTPSARRSVVWRWWLLPWFFFSYRPMARPQRSSARQSCGS